MNVHRTIDESGAKLITRNTLVLAIMVDRHFTNTKIKMQKWISMQCIGSISHVQKLSGDKNYRVQIWNRHIIIKQNGFVLCYDILERTVICAEDTALKILWMVLRTFLEFRS